MQVLQSFARVPSHRSQTRTDHTHLGWYRSSMHASHWTADTLHRMMRDASSENARLYGDRFIMLVFDVLDVAAP